MIAPAPLLRLRDNYAHIRQYVTFPYKKGERAADVYLILTLDLLLFTDG